MDNDKHEACSTLLCKPELQDDCKPCCTDVNTEKPLLESPPTVCSLDYNTFPHVLFHELPFEVQRLIKNRVKHSKCPLFVLVTHKNGQWCIVQLDTYSDSDELATSDDINAYQSYPESAKLFERFPEKRISSFELNLDQTTRAFYSRTSVNVTISMNRTAENWYCPFCSTCFSRRELSNKSAIEQHLRLHIELRCCIDCFTILPNDWDLSNSHPNRLHVCSDFVRTTFRNDTGQIHLAPDLSQVSVCVSQSRPTVVIPDLTHQDQIVCLDQEIFATDHVKDANPNSMPNNALRRVSLDPSLCSMQPRYSRTLSSVSPDVHLFTKPRHITTCLYCNIEFKNHDQYQRHMRNVHHDRRFLCPDCDASFSTKGNLTKHFTQVHNQNTGLICHVCQKRLSNKFNLDRHFRLVHSNSAQSRSTTLAEKITYSNDFPSQSTTNSNTPVPDSNSQSPAIQTGITSSQHYQRGTINTSPRGYYLYLSNKKSLTNYIAQDPCVASPDKAIQNLNQVSLVADVELTSCFPSNPDVQYGTRGTTWRPSVHIVESNASLSLKDTDLE